MKGVCNSKSAWPGMLLERAMCLTMGQMLQHFLLMQEAAFQGTELMADAFGMPSNQGMQYMPAPQQFEGGAMGYSSAPIFEGAQDALATNNPGQFDYINSFTIDPVTGARGSRMAASQPVKLEMTAPRKRGKRG